MSGKLPIDRVRAAQDAPSVYERAKQRVTKKQAQLEIEATRFSRPDLADQEGVESAAEDRSDEDGRPDRNP